ncbi:MAG: MBL fold metallo-hydrolase [Planctomycetaceae bacterium]|nr:MBL fold metallo-hydrolase [Planctomycetaceae bacterium]
MKIMFCGAAGEVTGSQHLIECGKLRILLDCGLFQGHRAECRRKNERFLHKPDLLDAVILSHAHIDHCGNLPGLFRAGYRGPVFCTDPTADVAEIMLDDGIHIQDEDARHLNKNRQRGQPRIEPLYSERDVRGIVRQIEPKSYGDWHELYPELRVRFRDAGHIIGSAICELEFQEKGVIRRLVFTGDLGRRELPLLRDPELVNGCDILISESTYGNRVHPPASDIKLHLLRIIRRAIEVEGKVIIPAFSLGRTQQLVYFLNELTNAGELPPVPVFVDSPLSNRVTQVFCKHGHVFDDEAQKALLSDTDAFAFPGLTYIAKPQESMELNHRRGPFVVIAASGMCESGRVLHHLKHGVADPNTTIVIIGFQAQNTLGRRIRDRQPFVKIFDREYPLRASVEVLEGLSAHADVNDFKWWYEHLASTTGVGQAFLVHGEPESSQALAGLLKDYCDEDPILPKLGETFEA